MSYRNELPEGTYRHEKTMGLAPWRLALDYVNYVRSC